MSKGKYGDRQSLMVDLIDTDKLTEICLQILSLQYSGSTDKVEYFRSEGWVVDGPLVIANDSKSKSTDPDRQYAIVCTEGVGWEADDFGRISVPIRNNGFSYQRVDIYAKVLWDLRTGEQVDLADHVRTFGDRLETNFSIWYHRFNQPTTVNA